MTVRVRSAILLTFDGCMSSMGATGISLLILDVDGVLTLGRVAVGDDAGSSRRFHVHDGCAIKLWRRCDGRVAILSGKSGNDITARAKELGVDWIETGATNKETAYNDILARAACGDEAVAYVGDDLPDLKPMARCGFAVAVADAVPDVKRAADYVTRLRGGYGAVAEIVELLLRKQKRWNRSLLVEA